VSILLSYIIMLGFGVLLPFSMYYNYGYYGTNIRDTLHQHLRELAQKFSNGLYGE